MNSPDTQAPNLTKQEIDAFVEHCKDPIWRLHNLYKITDKQGREIDFSPTAHQSAIIDAVYRQGQKRHIILKARQMGFSTLIDLMAFDAAYWEEGVSAAIVDMTQASATSKLNGKIKFAFDRLPPNLREEPIRANGSEIAWGFGSSIIAGKHARGTALQFLHISEWGPIAYEDPKRSEEIKTGALPAAKEGIIIIETTFKGGKGGHLYDLHQARPRNPTNRTHCPRLPLLVLPVVSGQRLYSRRQPCRYFPRS